jgi:FkbM family methyltransferase
MDIGANVGQHSVFMALKADYVFAFEPNSDAGEQLVENIRLNNLENVSLFPFALGSVDAEAVLGSGFEGNNASRSLKWSIDSSKDTRVEVRVGDQIVNGLGASRIDLIKVDVEGYEREVFLGLTETLKRDRPVILFELMTAEAKNAFRFGSELSSIFYPNVEIYSLAKNKSAQLGKVDWTHNDFVAIPAEVVPLFSDLIH